MLTRRLGAWSCLLLSALTGCPAAPRFEPPSTELRADAGLQLCQSLRSRYPSPPESRVLADASLRRGDDVYDFRYVIALKEPDKLRIDILPSEGAFTLGLLVSSDGTATILDVQKKTYVSGQHADRLIARFLGIEGLTRSAVSGLVNGRLPPVECSQARVFSDPGSVTVYDEVHRTVWSIRTDTGEIETVKVLDEAGERVLLEGTIESGAFGAERGVSLQMFEPIRLMGTLALSAPNPGKPISDSLFKVRIPTNYTPAE